MTPASLVNDLAIRALVSSVTRVFGMSRLPSSTILLTFGSVWNRQRVPSYVRCQQIRSASVRASSRTSGSSPTRRVPTTYSLRPAPTPVRISSECRKTVVAARVANGGLPGNRVASTVWQWESGPTRSTFATPENASRSIATVRWFRMSEPGQVDVGDVDDLGVFVRLPQVRDDLGEELQRAAGPLEVRDAPEALVENSDDLRMERVAGGDAPRHTALGFPPRLTARRSASRARTGSGNRPRPRQRRSGRSLEQPPLEDLRDLSVSRRLDDPAGPGQARSRARRSPSQYASHLRRPG